MIKRTEEQKLDLNEQMSNEEYRAALKKTFDEIEDNKVLRYFYIFITGKVKRTP